MRAATAAPSVSTMAVLLVLVGLGGAIEDMVGGWTWAALGFAVIESVLNLFGSVWLLGLRMVGLGPPVDLDRTTTPCATLEHSG